MGGRKLTYAVNVDEQILQWELEQRNLNLHVMTKCIMNHTLTAIQPLNPSFKASCGWLTKFMKRNNLSPRACTSVLQKLPVDLEEKISSFTSFVRDTREESDFDEHCIIIPSKGIKVTGTTPASSVTKMTKYINISIHQISMGMIY